MSAVSALVHPRSVLRGLLAVSVPVALLAAGAGAAPAATAGPVLAHGGPVPAAAAPAGSTALAAVPCTATFGQVIGDPDATVAGGARAGAVWYRPTTGSGPGKAVRVTRAAAGIPGSPAAGDRFGATVAVGDVDADGCPDLVVGAPGVRIDGRRNAGAVFVLFGSPSGPGLGKAGRTLRVGADGVHGTPQAGEGFGTALLVTGTSSGLAIAVGRPGWSVGKAERAGAVTIYRFGADGTLSSVLSISQNSAVVPGRSEAGDRFGSSLAATHRDVVVGVPGENSSAGVVNLLGEVLLQRAPAFARTWRQGAGVFGGRSEAGDRFGAAVSANAFSATGQVRVAIGAPGEDVGSARNAGAVTVVEFRTRVGAGDALRSTLLTQNTRGVAGTAETGDRFGAAVCVTSYLTDTALVAHGVAVGVPGQDVHGRKDAGAVAFFPIAAPWGDADRLITQASPGVPGVLGAGHEFGAVLVGAGAYDGLLVGVPDDRQHVRGSVVYAPWRVVVGTGTSGGYVWSPSSGRRAGAGLAVS